MNSKYSPTVRKEHSNIQGRLPKISDTAPKANEPTNMPAIKPASTLAAIKALSQIRLYWRKNGELISLSLNCLLNANPES